MITYDFPSELLPIDSWKQGKFMWFLYIKEVSTLRSASPIKEQLHWQGKGKSLWQSLITSEGNNRAPLQSLMSMLTTQKGQLILIVLLVQYYSVVLELAIWQQLSAHTGVDENTKYVIQSLRTKSVFYLMFSLSAFPATLFPRQSKAW